MALEREQGAEVMEEFEIDGAAAQVIRAQPGDISDEDFRELLEHLIDTNFVLKKEIPLADLRNRARGRVSQALGKSGDTSLGKTVKHAIYPDYSRAEHMEGSGRSITRLMKEGNMWAVQCEGRTVAMQCIRRLDGTLRGREIFEFTKASTLPDYEGKGLNKKLKDSMFRDVMSRHPNAVWFSVSRNPEHIARFQKRGWKVLPLDSDEEPARVQREHIGDYWKTMHEQGYKMVFLDPMDGKPSKLQELARRREAREIDGEDFDIYNWLNYEGGRALTREDLGRQAVVLQAEELRDIGILEIRLPDGREIQLDADDFKEDVLVIYPEDLG